jgi:Macrocin-O-methyltransferase (TylF)
MTSDHPRRRMPWSERLYRRFFHKYYARDLAFDLELNAKRESVAYVLEHMRGALMFRDRWDLLEFALERAPQEGLILEFGVENGASISFLAGRTERALHGFDSFEGLPEDWAGTYERRGKFSRGGAMPAVPGNVRLHKGWFDETLPPFLQAETGPVALLHVDCDIYSSTKTVLEALRSRLPPGSIIVFDEYFNYPNWRQHEWKAFQEFISLTGRLYDYLGFTEKNGHVAVRMR